MTTTPTPQPVFVCKGRAGGDPAEPQDCGWPTCGCDPYAGKVIEALQESGLLVEAPHTPTPQRQERAMRRRPLTSAEKDELIGLLSEIYTSSQAINDGFERTPGGDAYVYKGSMNSIETLREEHADLLEFRFRTGWSPSTES